MVKLNFACAAIVLLCSFQAKADSYDDPPSPEPLCHTCTFILPSVPLEPGEVDSGDAVSPLKKSQKAPFTGVLVSPSGVAKLVTELESRKEQVQVEVNRAREQEKATCNLQLANDRARAEYVSSVAAAQLSSKDAELAAANAAAMSDKSTQALKIALAAAVGLIVGSGIATLLLVLQ